MAASHSSTIAKPRKSSKSAKQRKPSKPDKPSQDFPLTASGNGQWVKRINKRVYCFGKWDDPQGALDRFNAEREYLENGKLPPSRRSQAEPDYLSVRHLCAAFLVAKQNDLGLGYISQQHFDDQQETCKTIVDFFGKERAVSDLGPDDFRKLREHLSKRKTGKGSIGGIRLTNLIIRCRQVFNFAWKECLIEQPIRYGTGFSTPPKKSLRRERNQAASKFLEPSQVRELLAAANDQQRAMILLAINGGLNPADLAAVKIADFDLAGGWLNFPRVKTEVNRRVPLWDETVAAVKAAIESRPVPKNAADADYLFITQIRRVQWTTGSIVDRFDNLKKQTGIKARNVGITALRHVLQTVGENATGNSFGVGAVMGHVPKGIAAHYREFVSDDRLRQVVNAVHGWLFGK